MIRMFCLLAGLILSLTLNAQEIAVTTYGESGRNGYKVKLENKPEKVEDFISSYFKATGKVKLRNGIFTITGLSRADFPFPEVTVYSAVRPQNENNVAMVWITDSLMNEEIYSEKLKNLWYNFAVDFYRSLVQDEINESNRALEYAEKQFQKLEKDSLNLKNDIEDNREEKLKLEEALKTNDLNHKVLLQKIENNADTRDSVLVAIDKIRRLIELQEQEKSAIE